MSAATPGQRRWIRGETDSRRWLARLVKPSHRLWCIDLPAMNGSRAGRGCVVRYRSVNHPSLWTAERTSLELLPRGVVVSSQALMRASDCRKGLEAAQSAEVGLPKPYLPSPVLFLAPPYPHRIPSVAPLINYERCYGGDTVRIGRGTGGEPEGLGWAPSRLRIAGMRRVQAGKGPGSPEAQDSASRYKLRRAATLTG